MLPLRTFEVSSDIFNDILYQFEAQVVKVSSLKSYLCGSQDKNKIYVDTKERQLICKELILDYFCDNVDVSSSWKQVRLIEVKDAKTEVVKSVDGQRCWNYMMALLSKDYSKKEIDEILSKIEPINNCNKQYHYIWPSESKTVQKLTNTTKYDINGAHLYILTQIFPRSASKLLYLYNRRHQNPIYKKYPNYFVGMLKKKKYVNAYNYIVDSVTKMLFKAIDEVDGILVYANTDGFVIKDAKKKLKTSAKLGDFKLEFEGDTYFYCGGNYVIYQFGDELKGTCLEEVRKYINLPAGEVVNYKKVYNKDTGCYKAIDINKEKVKCQEM